MSVLASTVIFILFVALVVLIAMAIWGINPIASMKTFAVCTIVALAAGVVVVGAFSLTDGSPRITRT